MYLYDLTYFYEGKLKKLYACFNKTFFVCQFYMFIIWCFFNSKKPDEVGKPIANETLLQF